MKKETLEEAAERISKTNSVYETAQDDFYHGFIEGAKWHQEKSYSEETELINWLQSLTAKKFYSSDAEDLFEQFKKK